MAASALVKASTPEARRIRHIRQKHVSAVSTLRRELRARAVAIGARCAGAVFAAGGGDVETTCITALAAADADRTVKGDEHATEPLVKRAAKALAMEARCGARRPFRSPPVFTDTSLGFDAIVGDPLFLGGQRFTSVVGTPHPFRAVPQLGNDRVRSGTSEVARREVLRRFGELSRQRYQEEHASGPNPLDQRPREGGGASKNAPSLMRR